MPAVRLTIDVDIGRAHALDDLAVEAEVARAAPVSGSRTWICAIAAPALAASIASSAIAAGVIGTRSDLPVVSPAPVTAQVMKTSQFTARLSAWLTYTRGGSARWTNLSDRRIGHHPGP